MKQGRVIVIGAGLAGLNAARVIAKAGHDVEIFESSERIGGRVHSDVIDGFICDRGFQVINPAYSELRETGLVNSLDIRPLPKGARIINGDDRYLVGDPRSDLRYLKGDLSSRSGSLSEKIRFLRYLWQVSEDVSFGVAMQECGHFYDRTLAPFLTGVFLSSPDSLSNRMARELIHWFIKGEPGLARGGAKRLPELLAQNLTVRFNRSVTKITTNQVLTSDGIEKCDAIVLAADPLSSARLCGIPTPEMAGCVTWYHSAPAETVSLKEIQIPLHSPIINSIVLSNTAADYAPKDRQLIATTTLIDINPAELHKELDSLWQRPTEKWELVMRTVVENALALHRPSQVLVQPSTIEKGIYLAGDWRAIPAQQGAMLSGRLAALAVISDLQAR